MKMTSYLPFVLLAVLVLAGFTLPGRSADVPAPATAPDASTWVVDNTHSTVGFKVKHLGISNVRGDFSDYEVALRFDPADLSTVEVNATIDIASIDTENEKRDNHLRSADFFSAEEYPKMTFVGKQVRNIDGSSFEIVGDLTIRGVTKEVVLDVEYLGSASMMGQERAAFEAETTINRLDYGLAWNKVTEAGGFIVGHDVTIQLDLEVTKATS